jgi:Fur family zinc uptake transcriptional regulator
MNSCTHEHDNVLHKVHDHSDTHGRLLEAEQLCLSLGARLTPLRKHVLQLILDANGPVGAYDLLAQLKGSNSRPAAPPTVYRTLDFLLEKGLIHRLSSINAFIPCCHPRAGHQAAFLICSLCHKVTEASAQALLQQLNDLTQADQFQSQHSNIEITGICHQCQS